MRKRAYQFCREMVWKEVARRYLEVFAAVKRERESRPRPVFQAQAITSAPREIPQPKLDHLIRLTDDVGMLQHAKFIVPDRCHGYCTDDNARALIAVLMALEMLPDGDAGTELTCTYLAFLHHAFNEETGRFRNFMGFDRRWLEETGSEDCHGRAIWGLGQAVALARSEDLRAAAQALFEKAHPALLGFSSPRAWSYALIGIQAYLSRFGGDSEVRRIRDQLSARLLDLYRRNAGPGWPWVEDILAYANGSIAQALILAGRSQEDPELQAAGIKSLEWLVEIQTDPRGHFVPVGNKGWYPRGGEKARFDQQPIEALAMIEACSEAYASTGESRWLATAQCCLDWFLGRNDLNVPLYDYGSGGCCDGLQSDGPNRNQGAESTLACFLSLVHINRLRSCEIAVKASARTAAEPPRTMTPDA